MKRNLKKAVALLCVLALCPLAALAADAAPGGLLEAQIQQALDAGRQIDATLRFALEDGVTAMIPAEYVQPARDLLDALELRAHLAKPGELALELVLSGQSIISGKAYATDTGVALETSLLPGRTLMAPYEALVGLAQSSMPTSGFDLEALAPLMQSVPGYVAAIQTWVQSAMSNVQISTAPSPATAVRDAATQSVSIRITGEQYKALYVALLDTAAADTNLKQWLSDNLGVSAADFDGGIAEGRQAVDTLQPGDGAVDINIYADGAALVGMDVIVGAIFGQLKGSGGSFNYGRLTGAPGQQLHTLRLGLASGGEEAGSFTLQVALDNSEPNTSLFGVTLDIVDAAQTGSVTAGLGVQKVVTPADGAETLENTVSFSLTGTGDAEGFVPAIDAGLTSSTETTVTADGFTSGAEITAFYNGVKQAGLRWTLADAPYTPSDASGRRVQDVTALTPEETAELGAALAQSVQALQGPVLQKLPPSVLSLLMGMAQ
ncbi:MAG: hypothetical protein LBU67_10170 [Oscillospiraceae bacterium]|nr:hypothetical protein [Oscillospiraceae bacterium]